jgi:hypothetical protein
MNLGSLMDNQDTNNPINNAQAFNFLTEIYDVMKWLFLGKKIISHRKKHILY